MPPCSVGRTANGNACSSVGGGRRVWGRRHPGGGGLGYQAGGGHQHTGRTPCSCNTNNQCRLLRRKPSRQASNPGTAPLDPAHLKLRVPRAPDGKVPLKDVLLQGWRQQKRHVGLAQWGTFWRQRWAGRRARRPPRRRVERWRQTPPRRRCPFPLGCRTLHRARRACRFQGKPGAAPAGRVVPHAAPGGSDPPGTRSGARFVTAQARPVSRKGHRHPAAPLWPPPAGRGCPPSPFPAAPA